MAGRTAYGKHFLFCVAKGGSVFFPEPHVVEGSGDNTGGWRDMCLLCSLGGILSKAQTRVHGT